MLKIPVGLFNAPSTYQRLMAGVLQGLIGRICLAYLDDEIVFSKKRSEPAPYLRAVFDRIRSAGLKLMPTKCSLFAYQGHYLGHVISAAGVSPDPAKLCVLADWPTPKAVREMQSFLGFVKFCNDYISDATELIAPLHNLTAARKCDESIKLTAKHLESFEEIKRRLCAALDRHTPISSDRLLFTQTPRESQSAPCCYNVIIVESIALFRFSRTKLSPAQRNYSTFERDCLFIICAFGHFRADLLGRKIRLHTDHRALAWLFSKQPTACASSSGWLVTLMEYPIVIEYVCGSGNSIAYDLSQLDSVAVDIEVLDDLARGVPSFACPATQVDRLEALTYWLAAQHAVGSILFVADLLRRRA